MQKYIAYMLAILFLVAGCSLGQDNSGTNQNRVSATSASIPPELIGTWQYGPTSGYLSVYTLNADGSYTFLLVYNDRVAGLCDTGSTIEESGNFTVGDETITFQRLSGSFVCGSNKRDYEPYEKVEDYKWHAENVLEIGINNYTRQ